MGPDGFDEFDASQSAVAYNDNANEYLVVWRGDDDTSPLVDGEFEIFGQRIDAATGERLGSRVRVSDMGPDGDFHFQAFDPAVTYNDAANEYLVVWRGTDDRGTLVAGEAEIFGQRLDATGAETGPNDFRISDMGDDGDTRFRAFTPAVDYNGAANEYLVVWSGDDDINDELEIFGQRLDSAGGEVGDDFRVSDMGDDDDPAFVAVSPAVTYNGAANEYLVVWSGEDDRGMLVDDERELFGQRLDSAGGEVGTDDFRISDMGDDGDASFGAFAPAVTYNGAANEYLVVWDGDDNRSPLVQGEFEIFGQRLDAAGVETGPNDFRISDMGPDGDTDIGASDPAVTYNGAANEYLVVWWRDDRSPPRTEESDIFGQRLDSAGAEIGPNDFRVSDMGPDGDTRFSASGPAVTYNRADDEYLVAWQGDDNRGSLVEGEVEIFGQRLKSSALPDVIGRDSDGTWQVGRNDGTQFVDEFFGSWVESAGWRDVAIGDIHNDGRDEVIGRDATGRWWVGINDGESFANLLYGQWNESANWRDVFTGDLDGDGDADVVGRTDAGAWWAGGNDGSQFVNHLIGFWNEAADWRDVMFADFDDDGDRDLVGRTSTGSWWLGRNEDGTLENEPYGAWSEAANWRDVAHGHFNDDSLLDVVGRTAAGNWWVGVNDGSQFVNQLFGFWNEAADWRDVAPGDFNDDGLADVVGRTAGGDWWIGRNDGGTFTNTPYGAWNEAANWRDVMFADFDRDDLLDVVGRTAGGDWWLGANNGSQFVNELYGQWDESRGWQDVSLGDFRTSAEPNVAGETAAADASSALAVALYDEDRAEKPHFDATDRALQKVSQWLFSPA